MNQSNRCAIRKAQAIEAENLVAEILRNQGWVIVARNYRWIGTEIDILATKGDSLVAIEVKFRSRFPDDMSSVEQIVPPRKLHALKRGLNASIRRFQKTPAKTRIDLVIVSPRDAAVAKTKTPSGYNPEGASNSHRGHRQNFRVAWYPAIGT